MKDQDVARIVRRMYEGFALRDLDILNDVLAPDCVWHISGSNILAGDHIGPEAITAMLTRARSSPDHDYRPELLDLDQLLLMRVENGRIVEVTAYPRDQAVYDEFWS